MVEIASQKPDDAITSQMPHPQKSHTFGHCQKIVKGQWWRVFGYSLVLGLLGMVAILLVVSPFFFMPEMRILEILSDTLCDITGALFLCMGVVFFLNNDYLTGTNEQTLAEDPPQAAETPAPEAHSSKKTERSLWMLSIVVVLGLAATLTAVLRTGRDIPAPDVSDLVVERHDIPAADNAYTYFLSATNDLYWPTNSTLVADYLDGETVDPEALATFLSNNENAMALVRRGTECQRCITPEFTDFDMTSPYLGPWINMSRLLAAKTAHDRLAGSYTSATDTCITHLKFADLIQGDAEGIIHYLVGIAALDLSLAQARELAQAPGMPLPELKKLSETLASLRPLTIGFIRAAKVEYKVTANTIDNFGKEGLSMDDLAGISGDESLLPQGKPIPGFLFQPNRTKLTFANLYRQMISNAPLSYAEMTLYDAEQALRLDENRWRAFARPNAIGRLLYALLMPAFEKPLERKCRMECNIAATRLLVGIHSYRISTGQLPENFEALVPDFLDTIPTDPYDGQPFRYNPEKCILYSVGKDGKDSGGSTVLLAGEETAPIHQKRWNMEDAVFKIDQEAEQESENTPRQPPHSPLSPNQNQALKISTQLL